LGAKRRRNGTGPMIETSCLQFLLTYIQMLIKYNMTYKKEFAYEIN